MIPRRLMSCVILTALAAGTSLVACTEDKSDDPRPEVVIPAGSQPAGRVVELGGGARVIFEDTLPEGSVLTVRTNGAPGAPKGLHALATPIELTLSGADIGRGATIEFPLAGLTEAEAERVHIATWDELSNSWIEVETTVDVSKAVIRARAPHFSWWAPWTLDWAAIGASVNQNVGQLIGKRAGPPECHRGTRHPDWVAAVVGVSDADALAIRGCVEGEGDLLVVELVNNRPYGQVLTYGSPVQFGWREAGDSLSDKARNAIMTAVLGDKKLYLPPKGRATVGIKKLELGKMVNFHAGLSTATMLGDLVTMMAPKLLEKAGARFASPLAAACGAKLFTTIPPEEVGNAGDAREQLFDSLGCVEQAFYKGVEKGLFNRTEVGQLVDALDALKSANLVGRIITAYDVEWKLLDLYVDTHLVPAVPGLGYGFSVRAKAPSYPDAPPVPSTEPTRRPEPPSRPVASQLSVELSENPFLCNTTSHRMGILTGAHAGERIAFTSPDVAGLLPGTADGNGRLNLRWQCSPQEAGRTWRVTATGGSGSSISFTVTGRAPAAQPVQQPGPQRGFNVEDSYLAGTWARRDPDDGTWHSRGNPPGNAAYWFANGLGIAVDCARSAAPYEVKFADRREQWSWWLHVTDNTWIPAAAVRESSSDGPQGVRAC